MQLTRLKGLLEESPQVYHTTAILCRTMEEAKALHQLLAMEDIALLEDSSESLGSRFVLTTIQVAKGMEFDEVIIWNATDEAYHTAKEQMMLYTTCTKGKTPSIPHCSKGQKIALFRRHRRRWNASNSRILKNLY